MIPADNPLPSGTVTFLFTDIEGSTRLWEEHAEAMGPALAEHDGILRRAVEAAGGRVVKTTGDGMLALFDSPAEAVEASIAAQRELRLSVGGPRGVLRVRMAVHAGPAERRARQRGRSGVRARRRQRRRRIGDLPTA